MSDLAPKALLKKPEINVGERAAANCPKGDVSSVGRRKTRYRSQRWASCPICKDMFKRGLGEGRKLCCPECHDLRTDARIAAASAVHYAVRTGVLPHHSTLKCADCGATASGYEHRDYSKPLEVEPICTKCNAARGPASFDHLADGVEVLVLKNPNIGKRDFNKVLTSRWRDLSPELAEKSAITPVWLLLADAEGPVKWIRKISQEAAKQMGALKWAPECLTDSLSHQELNIFLKIAVGKCVTEISKELFLSVKTVSTYRQRVCDKTGLKTNVQFAIYAFRTGLVEWPRGYGPVT